MESWNHSRKVEAVRGERLATREMAKTQVFEYIEVYYNRWCTGYCKPLMSMHNRNDC